ncbi:helix-turn-helix domain-containing protein [Actinospica durhamensis]|uniref:PucR family transcriptional regulator n=1 Tax=Actinospica durhamensis TaxID=1508375 RepID=UPI001FE6A9B4|nr:PucR family transcriptional regulator [Actinospica durhamensis]
MRPEQMVDLAEEVFTHVDQIATACVLGYAQAKADLGEARERRRRLLAEVLAGTRPDLLATAAEEADWALPEVVACVALGPGTGWREAADPRPTSTGYGARLPEEVLAELSSPDPHLLLPEPEAWLDKPEIIEFLRDRRAVVGPTVSLRSAADSLRWARLARERLSASALDHAPIRCDGHLPALLLLGDEALVRLIGERRLAPLGGLTVKQRERLESTLLAWLDTSRGTAPEVAARLGIHPQTARSRLHRMQELLGSALAHPESRFEIEVALRGRRLLARFGRAA